MDIQNEELEKVPRASKASALESGSVHTCFMSLVCIVYIDK